MKDKKKSDFWAEMWREAILATTLGWDLAIPIFGGTLIGYFLDQWLLTGHTFTLGLMVAGIGISYYNVWRFIRKLEQKTKDENQNGEDEKQV